MRYWLTTHWPHLTDVPPGTPHSGMWLPDGKIAAAHGMEAGDLAFIYETQGGKTVVERYADGTEKRMTRKVGRQGVVALVEILDRPSQPPASKPESYADGTTTWWRYNAATRSLNSTGFVPRGELLTILGYSPEYYFKAFGTLSSGLGELTLGWFEAVRAIFDASSETLADAISRRVATNALGRGEGGEGPIHRALKAAIAADPSATFAESGLRLWQTEYQLPTGDRIDIVLTDKFGRFVVVEIEPDCAADEIVGPMQCAKYRALMAFMYDRPVEEVRAMLVARSIHNDVAKRCSAHRIESRLPTIAAV